VSDKNTSVVVDGKNERSRQSAGKFLCRRGQTGLTSDCAAYVTFSTTFLSGGQLEPANFQNSFVLCMCLCCCRDAAALGVLQ